jgi:hypothetical protein
LDTWKRTGMHVLRMKNLDVKRLLGGPSYRWKNIKLDLKEIELASVDWMHVGQVRDERRALVNTVNNFRYHKMLGKFLSG